MEDPSRRSHRARTAAKDSGGLPRIESCRPIGIPLVSPTLPSTIRRIHPYYHSLPRIFFHDGSRSSERTNIYCRLSLLCGSYFNAAAALTLPLATLTHPDHYRHPKKSDTWRRCHRVSITAGAPLRIPTPRSHHFLPLLGASLAALGLQLGALLLLETWSRALRTTAKLATPADVPLVDIMEVVMAPTAGARSESPPSQVPVLPPRLPQERKQTQKPSRSRLSPIKTALPVAAAVQSEGVPAEAPCASDALNPASCPLGNASGSQREGTTSGSAPSPNHGVVLLKSYPPHLPPAFRHLSLRTFVTIEFRVDAQGNSTAHLITGSSYEELDALALVATRRWVFEPAARNGQPVAARVRLRIHFQVE